jgi:hypothetical protein
LRRKQFAACEIASRVTLLGETATEKDCTARQPLNFDGKFTPFSWEVNVRTVIHRMT